MQETGEDQEGEYDAGCDWEEEIALMPGQSAIRAH